MRNLTVGIDFWPNPGDIFLDVYSRTHALGTYWFDTSSDLAKAAKRLWNCEARAICAITSECWQVSQPKRRKKVFRRDAMANRSVAIPSVKLCAS